MHWSIYQKTGQSVMAGLDDDFKKIFPRLNFKLKDFQKRAIENVLLEGNTLCIMPKSGGKSIIYQMAALRLGSVALVVSPLIALMVEQAEKIRAHSYDVLEFHSGINSTTQNKNLKDFAKGTINPRFIFTSPEKLAVDGFFEYCLKQRKGDIKLVVIDEVHCVSQWGIDFRPFYKRIPDFLNRLFDGDWSKILALTATLNPKELFDICADFKILRENVLIDSLLIRQEIELHVLNFSDENAKEEKFWELLNMHRGEKILVYVYRKYKKRGVEDLCEKARDKGYKATYFHGDLSADERKKIIDEYKSGAVEIVGKGFPSLIDLESTSDAELKNFFDGTRTKGFVRTVKKFSITPEYLADKVYDALLNDRVKFKNPLKHWLVVNLLTPQLSAAQVQIMADDIAAKKTYKHKQLSYFVNMLENVEENKLHQEIGLYLGADRFNLNKIYQKRAVKAPSFSYGDETAQIILVIF